MRQYFLLSLATCLLAAADAQVSNTGVLYVSSGTTLNSGGNFTNSAGASYQNDGTIYISGNISNDQANMPAGAGVTILNGSAAQTLSGSAPFRCFNLTLNNAAGLTLSNRLAIGDGTGGTLTFTAGEITAGTNTQDVYFYPGSAYAGFDASHHVIGYVTKSGNTDFTFPIGDGAHQAAIDLTSLSAASDFQVLYHPSGYGAYNANPPITTGGIFISEWWDINRPTGSASATVTLKWDDTRKVLDHSSPSTLVVAHYTGGVWQSEGGTSSSPSGSITGSVGPSNAVSSFSPFTFGSTTTPLPIVLGAFAVTNKDCKAALSWSTQIEENAAGFDIEESANGIIYSTVGYVKAKGVPSDYGLTVIQNTRLAFYRIRLVDLDGHFVYSPVATLQLDCMPEGDNLVAFPNPLSAGTDLTVKYTSVIARGQSQLQLFDMTGRKALSIAVPVNSGINTYTIPAGLLPQGVYTLFIAGDNWKSGGVQVVR